MTCRDCIHHGACADIVEKFLEERHPDWEDEWYFSCGEFDAVPVNESEVPVNIFKAPAATKRTMDDYAVLLVKIYGEYTRGSGCLDDDYARAVAKAIKLLGD